jgi:hypothetical protein
MIMRTFVMAEAEGGADGGKETEPTFISSYFGCSKRQ